MLFVNHWHVPKGYQRIGKSIIGTETEKVLPCVPLIWISEEKNMQSWALIAEPFSNPVVPKLEDYNPPDEPEAGRSPLRGVAKKWLRLWHHSDRPSTANKVAHPVIWRVQGAHIPLCRSHCYSERLLDPVAIDARSLFQQFFQLFQQLQAPCTLPMAGGTPRYVKKVSRLQQQHNCCSAITIPTSHKYFFSTSE